MTEQEWKQRRIEEARVTHLGSLGLPRRILRAKALAEAREPVQPIPEPDEDEPYRDSSARRSMLT